MQVSRGEVWWADLPDPVGSAPGYRRPVLIVQSEAFNRSRLATVVVVVLTANLRLLEAPANVLIPSPASGLARDSVANVSQILTVDRGILIERAGRLPPGLLKRIEDGLRVVLDL